MTKQQEKFFARIAHHYSDECRRNYFKLVRQPGLDKCHPQDLLEEAIRMTYPEQLNIDTSVVGALRFNSP